MSVVSRLNDASKAIDNWKNSVNEAILNSSENPDVATQNFEKLLTEKTSLLEALSDSIEILENKRASFTDIGSESDQQSENESEFSETLNYQFEA